MARFKGQMGSSMVVLYLMYILNAIVYSQSDDTVEWYMGCYTVSPTSVFQNSIKVTEHPAECSKHCLLERYTYAVLLHRNQCGCANDTSVLSAPLPDDSCSSRCGLFPCGGANDDASIYLSAGPFLYKVTCEVVESPVYTDDEFSVEVDINLASLPDVSLGVSDLGFPGHPERIAINWTLNGTNPQQESITLSEPYVRHGLIHNISVAGLYLIDIEVSNILSILRISTNVTVLLPEPNDLQVTLLTDKQQLPSCMPGEVQLEEGKKTVSVFAGDPVIFEATVAVGYNITFEWVFSDDDSRIIKTPTMDMCEGRQCTTSLQDHVFATVGQYQVTVNASNSLGSAQDSIIVMVVRRELANLMFVVHKDSPTVAEPNALLRFLVAMETTARHEVSLQVTFGDGSKKEYKLSHSFLSGKVAEEGDALLLLSNYTDGNCSLNFELRHTYTTQGEFQPKLTLMSNFTADKVLQLDKVIHIINRLTAPVLTGPKESAVNRKVNLSAASMRNTPNVTYYWSVVDEEQLEEHNITTKLPTLSHQFSKPGQFTVHMKAQNAINSVLAFFRITVLIPVTDLTLSSDPDQPLRTGEQVSYSAELGAGTLVEYEWDISDQGGETLMGEQNLSAYANHTFNAPGSYNISVKAYNAVSWLTTYLGHLTIVQDPVGDLDVVVDSPVLNLTNVTMIVTVSTGTDVMVSVDYGQGPEHYGRMNGRSLNIVKVFTEVQEHQINVTAFNNVSSVTQALVVDVRRGIGIINVSLPSRAMVTEPVIFAVYVGGDLSKRDDLVYTWLINGTVVNRTRVPVIDMHFTKTGLYNVTVVAENDVANASAMQPVIVEADDSNTRFANPSVAVFNQTTRLVLKNLPDGPLEIRVKYGDGNSKNIEVDADNLTLEYTYKEVMVCEVTAIIYLNGSRIDDLATVIAVQEPLMGLELTGPSAVPLNRSSVEYTWTAEVGSGSHTLFEWFINNELTLATTRTKLTWRFRHAGMYNISVRASNSLSSLTASSNVAVEYSISSVRLQVPPTVRGRAAQLVLVVHGGPHVNLSVSYGDGQSLLISSTELTSENLTTLTDVVHRYNLSYNFSQVGVYEVSVNVSNHVSFMQDTSRATVEEPIEGVVLTSQSPRIVHFGQPVVVSVSIASGTGLICDWDFGDVDSPPPDKNCSESAATHIFTRPGNYSVRVLVSNNLYNEAVAVDLPGEFAVVQEIKGLAVRQEGPPAVKLVRGRGGTLTTGPVIFVASIEEGSDVIYTFNYGDGTTEEVRPASGEEAFGKHSFTSANAYDITVSGRNLLSNVTVSLGNFHVQVAPSGLRLDRARYIVAFGNSTAFNASLQEGTDVVFDWDMGDGREYKNVGPLVRHQYLAQDQYSVTLSASNRVGQVEAKAQVDVTQPLQGVRLAVDVTKAQPGTEVHFTAEPYPRHETVSYYQWNLGTARKSTLQSLSRHYSYVYESRGIYTVTVRAHDSFGYRVSKPVQVHIIEPISAEFSISVSGEQLINHRLEFGAKHFRGSDMTYVWNFGDGTGDIETQERKVDHTYDRTGEFNVVVEARNPLGNRRAMTQVFVLLRPCRPPKISMLSTPGGTKNKVYRSADLKVEAEVRINCSITSSAKYRWFLKRVDSEQELRPTSLSPSSQHDAIFYLPPRSLEYGKYTLNLTVEMYKTSPRVYATESTHFEVTKSPLLAVISGGIKRLASRQENVVLDASASTDPDDPSFANFKYEWSCYQLNWPGESCFHSNKTMASWVGSKQDVMIVPGSAFNVSVDDFVVNITLSKEGRQPSNTSQVLTMQQQRLINVKVSCRECHDHVINKDQKMVLYTEHPGVREEDVIYEWQVYVVEDDGSSDSAAGAHEGGSCVQADGSTYQQYLHSLKNNSITTGGSSSPSSSQGPPNVHTTTTRAPSTTTATAAPPINPFPVISEGTSSGGRGSAGGEVSIRGEGLAEGSLDFPPIHENSGGGGSARGSSMGEGLPAIGEAHPGEAGSAAGRRQGVNPAMAPSEGSTGGRNTANSGTRPSTNQNHGDEAIDAISHTETVGHIVSRIRYPIIIKPQHTSTGFNQRALGIRKGVLKQGTTYVIEVKVSDKEDGRVGTASVYFEVNESPSLGECSIQPDDEGVEMLTEFRIFCIGWKDADLPIHYEVSYSLGDAEQDRQVVYRGLNHIVSFQLPAGHARNNHTVEVFISILDSLGARTQVCSLPITVRPRSFQALNKTEEQILYDFVKGNESPLQIYVSSGDNRNVRLQTQLVAHRLNRLNATGQDDQRTMRRQIREAMLHALYDLPMRDEYEVQQTTAAVASSTAVTNELEVVSLLYASDILEKAVRQVETLASRGKQLDTTNIAFLTIDGAANILAAVIAQDVAEQLEKDLTTHSPLALELEASNQVEEVVEKSRNAVHSVLKSEMQQWVVGERVFTKDTGNLLTEAGRFRASLAYTRQSQLTNFVLPSNMQQVLHSNVKLKEGNTSNKQEDCYQAHMLTFRTNPYIYSKNKKRQVQTQVASLTLFTCEGQELSVDGLPPNDLVNMHIPHQELNSQDMESDLFVLEKHYMNVHQFNVSEANLDQSLHIHVDLEPAKDKHVFPISILVSVDEPPNPENHFIQKNFGRDLDNLKVYVEANKLKAGKQYYIGLVDVEFNAGRPRAGEVRQRQYRLWLWWGDCLYWKEAANEWSPDGCHISPAANFSHIQCNCNHLTSFGAHFSLAPNDLSFTDVEAFIDLHENPVTFVFVLCLLTLYLLLLVISVKLDRHDSMKGSIVHLVDNKTVDKQAYMVTLETGFRKGAGTTAKVSLVLHGEHGMSEMRELVSESGQLLFERNSRDTFIVSLRENLGKVWKVQLWHNNAGPAPSWYLSRVTVKDLTAGHTYYFSCEKWFAVEEDDGKIEREIMLQEGGLGFGKVLWAKGTQYFADFHIWLSVFSRPSYSRFTRAQRLTCALALILSYMAVNAAWYQFNEKEYRGEFGLIDISWRSVYVGIITAILVLPVNFIIMLIFRRSKVKKVRLEEFPEKKHFANKRDSLSSLDSTVRLLQPVVTQSIFDQSMLNWQNLQEWAQRQWAKRYQQSVNSSLQNVKPPNPQQIQMAEAAPLSAQLPDTHDNDAAKPEPPPDSKFAARLADTVDLASVLPEVTDSTAVSNRSSASMVPPSQRSGRGLERQAGPEDMTGQSQEPLLRNRSTHSDPCGHSSNNSFSIATSTEGSRLHPQPRQLLLMQGGIRFVRSGKKQRCFLPCWCVHIAWFLCAVVILGCATITILYGFRFGRAKSIMWLQSLFFSFIQCVFITHPFIILIISVVTAIRYHDNLTVFDHHNDGVIETFQGVVNNDGNPPPYTEKEEEFDLATGIAQRQRSRYLRFARPPQEKHLIEARKTTLKQKKTGAVFSETMSFSILLFLLLVVAFGKDSQTPFRLNSSLTTLLTKTGSLAFKDIQTMDQWWQWSQNDLLDLLYGDGQSGKIIIGNSQLVGQVSLRQKRIRPSMCGLPVAYSKFRTCYEGYTKSTSQKSSFTRNNFTMHYKETDETGASCVVGRFAYYDSAGHQMFLPSDRKGAAALLQELYDYEWLGHQTRAVMVEFVLFHAPSNLFSSVHLMLETPPVGRAFPYTDITSAYVYKYISHFDNFILACELLLIIYTMILLHSEVESAIRMKKEYLKSPWNCIQVTVLCLLMAYIACYLYRYMLVGNVVNALRSSYNSEYVDTSFIAYWDHLLRSFLGFIIFLLLIQALHLLRNRPLFAKFGAIYRKTVYEIVTFGGLFMVWACAYTSLGVALYSAVSLDFSRWDTGLGTVVGLMTRHYNLEDLEAVDPGGLRLFVISFLMLALSSLTGYIVAVLIYHLKRHHSNSLPPLSTTQALHYLWNKLLMLVQLQQPRCVHEDNGVLPAEFTMAEIEYQVEEMLFKMNALAGTSGLPDKPSQYFTDSDCTYPSPGEDAVSSGSEPRFDDGRFERRINKIEDNLVTFEPHLAQLLQLDAIGAHILTSEHEKQLRSQLELEIFRRLQLQRPDIRPPHANRLPSSGSNTTKMQASNSSSGCQASAEASPSTASPPGHAHKSFFLPASTGGGQREVRGTKPQGGSSSSKPSKLPPGEHGLDKVKMSDGLILQDLSEDHNSCQDTAIPLQEIKRPAPVTLGKTPPAVTRRSHEDHASGSSCSSGAAEIQYVLNLKKAKELAKDIVPLTGAKPKAKLSVDNSTVYDVLHDYSSGSEGEIAPSKARSLRKTKSRGKGKGRRGLNSDGFDDFAFDNHAFSYGSDRDNKKDSSMKKKHAAKQAR